MPDIGTRTPQYIPRIQAIIDRLNAEPTIGVPDVGTVLGVSRASAYNAVRSGEIPSIKVGRSVRVPSAAVLRLLGIGGDAA